MHLVGLKLKVSHYPQIPCKPFEVEVANEFEAAKVVKILALQHLFLFENKIIPDYANSISVSIMCENGEWVDYWNDKEGMDWGEFAETYLKDDTDTGLGTPVTRSPNTEAEIIKLVEVLTEAGSQIKYLHEKFQETGSGNNVLSRIEAIIQKYS